MTSSSTGSSRSLRGRTPPIRGKSRSRASAAGPSSGESAGRYLTIGGTGLLLGLIVAEVLLRALVVPIIDSQPNRIHLIYHAELPDAVLGDSRLYRSFINSERFANLARAGSSPHALEIVAREYFRHVDPGDVVVEASPQLFNELMQTRRAQRHDEYFTHNFGLPFQLYVFEPGISRELASVWDFPGLLHEAEVARGSKKLGGPLSEREAARRRALSEDERRELTAARIESNRPVPDVRTSSGFSAYRRTLDFLLSRGARVCLARTPVTDLYLAMSRDEPNHVAAEQALRDLAAELGIRFVDYVDLDLPLTPGTFTNPDHVTTRMGEVYAASLERACFERPTTPKAAP